MKVEVWFDILLSLLLITGIIMGILIGVVALRLLLFMGLWN